MATPWNISGIVDKENHRYHKESFPPDQILTPFILAYWSISWDFPPNESCSTLVVPSGCVNVLYQQNQSRVVGLRTEAHEFVMGGKDQILGVLFHPGTFYPFFKQPISNLLNQVVPLKQTPPLNVEGPLFEQKTIEEKIQFLDAHFLKLLPETLDQSLELVQKVVDFIISKENENISRVEQVTDHFKLDPRKLQRLFDKYVGISPKMFIRTRRFQFVLQQMNSEKGNLLDIDWATFSYEMGYTDQAHFINDFRKFAGVSPSKI